MNCPNCGAKISEGELFCGECGTKLGSESVVQPQPAQTQSSQNSNPQTQSSSSNGGKKKALKKPILIAGAVWINLMIIMSVEGKFLTQIIEWDAKNQEQSQEQFKKNLEMTKNNFKQAGKAINDTFGLTDSLKKLTETLIDVGLTETDKGVKLSVQNIQFKPNSNELVETDKARIADIAKTLKNVGDYNFLVVGHTADDGGDTSNDVALSLGRANTVISEMAKAGISSKKFMASGAGCSEPIADNSTAEGRARNRRVEITILTK